MRLRHELDREGRTSSLATLGATVRRSELIGEDETGGRAARLSPTEALRSG